MAMTLRLDAELAAKVRKVAELEGISQHELIVRAVQAYTSRHQQRLDTAITRVVTRDRGLLDRLAE